MIGGHCGNRQRADIQSPMVKDGGLDGRRKRKRMLTLEEMLNPADEKQVPRDSEDDVLFVDSSDSGDEEIFEPGGEGDKKGKKPRVARDIRHRTRDHGKRN